MGEETSTTTCKESQHQQNSLGTYNAFLTASACGELLAEALAGGRVADGERQSAKGITAAGCRERNVWLALLALVTAAGLALALMWQQHGRQSPSSGWTCPDTLQLPRWAPSGGTGSASSSLMWWFAMCSCVLICIARSFHVAEDHVLGTMGLQTHSMPE